MAPDRPFGGDCVCRQLDHPHGPSVPQRRLQEAPERGGRDGRSPGVQAGGGGLCLPVRREPEGDEGTGLSREENPGARRHDDDHRERPRLDGAEPRPVVPLLPRGRRLRRVHLGARPRAGRALPEGLPFRGRDRLHRLLARPLAEHDLVQARLPDDAQVERGRPRLRAPDGRDLRLALAPLSPRAATEGPRSRACRSRRPSSR